MVLFLFFMFTALPAASIAFLSDAMLSYLLRVDPENPRIAWLVFGATLLPFIAGVVLTIGFCALLRLP